MSYITIEDFTAGLDKRRGAETSKPGVLVDCIGAHITRGGEIEQHKEFFLKYNLPANTFGMWTVDDRLYVFGSAVPPTLPSGVSYQQLAHPAGTANMVKIRAVDNFNGLIEAIAEFDDGSRYVYYDGVHVTDWDARAAVIGGDNESVAKELADKINENSAVNATALGEVITIIASVPGTAFTIIGSATNGVGVNDQTLVLTQTVANAPGVSQAYTAEVGGTFEVDDKWVVTINGEDYKTTGLAAGMPTAVRSHASKAYTPVRSILQFSSVDHPEQVTTGTGFGFINMANQSAGSEKISALEIYQNNLAVFSRRTIQVWFMDVDPDANTKLQVIKNSGTRSPKSVLSYGDTDVFYLDDSGVRSLRSRAGYSAAFVSDVGTAIDTYIQEYMDTLNEGQIRDAVSIQDPRDGRYWLAMGSRIFVLTYFPSSKISAWSEYRPGFNPDEAAYIGRDIYIRSGDSIYKYGGEDGNSYDDTVVTVQMSYMTADKIGTPKLIEGIDVACEGRWLMEMLVDPRDQTKKVQIGIVEGSTYLRQQITMPGETTHFAPKFTSIGSGKHMLKKVSIYFELGDEED